MLHVTTARLSGIVAGPVCFATSAAPAGVKALIQCGSFGRLAGPRFTRLRGGLTAAEVGNRGFIYNSTALTETAAW